jgi:uncharacterized protein YqiB (DUF1249 family)
MTNMMEMKFNTMQLILPPKDEKKESVKYQVVVHPGQLRFFIIRQVRAEKYALAGG